MNGVLPGEVEDHEAGGGKHGPSELVVDEPDEEDLVEQRRRTTRASTWAVERDQELTRITHFDTRTSFMQREVPKFRAFVFFAAAGILAGVFTFTLMFAWQSHECLQEPTRYDIDRRTALNGSACILASTFSFEGRGVFLHICWLVLPLSLFFHVPFKKVMLLVLCQRVISVTIKTTIFLNDSLKDAYGSPYYTADTNKIFDVGMYFFLLWYYWDANKYYAKDKEMNGINILNTVTAYMAVVWRSATTFRAPALIVALMAQAIIVLRYARRDPCAFHDNDICWASAMIGIISFPSFTLYVVLGIQNSLEGGFLNHPIFILLLTQGFFRLFGTIAAVWTAVLSIRNRYIADSPAFIYMFTSGYSCGLLLVYRFYSWMPSMFIILPLLECIRDGVSNYLQAATYKNTVGFPTKSEELLWWEEMYYHKIQSTIAQALSAVAVFVHVLLDILLLKLGYATAPVLRCQLACLSVGACLEQCESDVRGRLTWASVFVILESVGVYLCIMFNRQIILPIIKEYFEADKKGKSGKEKAGLSPFMTGKDMVCEIIPALKDDGNDVGDFISPTTNQENGRYGHPYTHLPPRILDFEGDIDKFTSYSLWTTRYWIFLMIFVPLPYVYQTLFHEYIPTGVTRPADGLLCYNGSNPRRCYTNLIFAEEYCAANGEPLNEGCDGICVLFSFFASCSATGKN